MFSKIKRNDLVQLPDGSEGKVVDVLNTGSINVYKVEREGHLDYFEENKLRLKKRHFLNSIFDFLSF